HAIAIGGDHAIAEAARQVEQALGIGAQFAVGARCRAGCQRLLACGGAGAEQAGEGSAGERQGEFAACAQDDPQRMAGGRLPLATVLHRRPRWQCRPRRACVGRYNSRFSTGERPKMSDPKGALEVRKRRTFAIISHPDAGKTTLTEKLLLFGGAIQLAGTVKGRKAARHATSDWMRLEQQRGISVTSSVMQFPFNDCIVNLLDTPGHEDFSEDTYRTLTAVDSALMVIDCAKGVEERTIRLMEVCRLRATPIMTFINKLDREGRAPLDLLDEIEKVLKLAVAPVTWPIGMGRELLGIYHLREDRIYAYEAGARGARGDNRVIEGLHSEEASEFLGDRAAAYREEVDLVRGAATEFDLDEYLAGRQTPVFFGSAISNFGVEELLRSFTE